MAAPSTRRSTQATRGDGRALWRLLAPVLIVVGAGAGFVIGRTTADQLTSDGATPPATAFTEADQAAIDALLQDGLSLHLAGDLEAAAATYQQVLSVAPTNKYALFNLGLIAHTNEDYETAVTDYEAALAVDVAYAPARFNLGIVYAAQKRWTKAQEAFQAVLDAEPENAAAMYQLGLARVAQGDSVGGQQLIDRAAELDPSVTASSDPTG